MGKSPKTMYSNIWTLIRCALAAYRLAQLFSIDDGPMRIFANLRQWARKSAAHEQIRSHGRFGPRQSLAEGLECPYCVGVWMAVFVALCAYVHNPITEVFLDVLAIAGGQALLQGARHAE